MTTRRTKYDFSEKTKRELAKRAGHRCSNPSCNAPTSSKNSVGEAAHIYSVFADGPRYNSNVASEEASDISNGVHLCANCHSMIDKNKGKDYPAKLLQSWKNQCEHNAEQTVGKTQPRNNLRLPITTPKELVVNQKNVVHESNSYLIDKPRVINKPKRLGIIVACLSKEKEIANKHGYTPKQGVLIKAILPNTIGSLLEIPEESLLREINGEKIYTLLKYKAAIILARKGNRRLQFLIKYQGQNRYFVFDV